VFGTKTALLNFQKKFRIRFKIISSGGTAKTLSDAGVKVIPIQDVTVIPKVLTAG